MARSDDPRFWDKIARRYAADPIKDTAGYERTLERTRALLSPGDTVLELGCGTGATALRLAPHVERLVATDLSAGMIAIAREKAAAQGAGNVAFEVAAAGSPGLGEASFDAVLAFNLWHLVDERAAVLAEVRRLLKPGGLLVSKTPCLAEMNPLIRLAIPVMQLVGKAPYVATFSAAEHEREIESAGFAIVERARHGSKANEPRIFLVARKTA